MTKYFTDGWMIGKNPSPIGGGFTVVREDGQMIKLEEIKKVLLTNNEAEIRGIYFALEYADKGDTVSTDSMCCLTWVNAGKSKARPDLDEILQKCCVLKFKKRINLMWEGREFNLAGKFNESMEKRNFTRISLNL